MSTDNPCERHLFGADGQCVGCGKTGVPKATAMSMTKERLAELKFFVEYYSAPGLKVNEGKELVDAVEVLQAELAEEQANRQRADDERHYMHEDLCAERAASAEAEDIANLAMRQGLAMLEEERAKREAAVDRAERAEYSASNVARVLEDMTEMTRSAHDDRDAAIQRAEKTERERDEALMLALGLRRDLHNEIVRFCCLDSNLSDVDEEREAAEKRAQEAEDIANLAMRVGLEMVEEANAWGQAAVCKAVVDRDLAIQRAEAAERDLRAEARREALEEAAKAFRDSDNVERLSVLEIETAIRALKEKKP